MNKSLAFLSSLEALRGFVYLTTDRSSTRSGVARRDKMQLQFYSSGRGGGWQFAGVCVSLAVRCLLVTCAVIDTNEATDGECTATLSRISSPSLCLSIAAGQCGFFADSAPRPAGWFVVTVAVLR